jgi:type III secretion system-like peptide-binding chaperone
MSGTTSGREAMTTLPAQRFVLAQSWWIARELVRRHPHLRLIETHPGGGQYDCLTLLDSRSAGPGSLVDLNRAGRIHVDNGACEPLGWDTVFAARGGHDIVRRIEAVAGLHPLVPAPPTGPSALTYRVLARILTSLVDDRHTWDVRNGQLDSSGYGGGRRSELDWFPSAVKALRDVRPDDLFQEPAYRFWILLRDTDPVVVLDTDGRLHLRNQLSAELLAVYKGSSRSLTITVAEVLGHLLS